MRGANPHATSMMGQSAGTYASNDLIHQMLDQAAQARQLQEYGQSCAEVRCCLGFRPHCLHADLVMEVLQKMVLTEGRWIDDREVANGSESDH